MDLIDHIQAIAARIPKQLDRIQTEEATKTALVMPFIQALGYNVFDPTEVVPEFTADVGIKKGEKVDYAIFKDDTPVMLFECKSIGCNLAEAHASQLFRYFTVVTSARIAVLTNGVQYWFYTDLEEPNKMDAKPFLELDLMDIREPTIAELKKLTKSSFDLDRMVAAATGLKYTKEIQRLLADEINDPCEDFVKFFASRVLPGRLTQTKKEEFTVILKDAFKQFINDRISDRLKSALEHEDSEEASLVADGAEERSGEDVGEGKDARVVTTQEEMEGYYIVKAILCPTVDPARIVHRDTQSYFGILLDDNNRKPICRLHFNRSQKYLGLFDRNKIENRVPVNGTNDIFRFAERLRETVAGYDQTPQTPAPAVGKDPTQ